MTSPGPLALCAAASVVSGASSVPFPACGRALSTNQTRASAGAAQAIAATAIRTRRDVLKDELMELDDFTSENMTPYVGSMFHLTAPNGQTYDLKLVQVLKTVDQHV